MNQFAKTFFRRAVLLAVVLSSIGALANHCISQSPDLNLNESDQDALRLIAEKHFTDLESSSRLLKENPIAVREFAWQCYLKSPLGLKRKSDFEKNQVTFEKHLSPYTIKTIGERPENGWPLFIAMHGGGGATQELNDSQWRHM